MSTASRDCFLLKAYSTTSQCTGIGGSVSRRCKLAMAAPLPDHLKRQIARELDRLELLLNHI
jgi:hypothetical protein